MSLLRLQENPTKNGLNNISKQAWKKIGNNHRSGNNTPAQVGQISRPS